jgi:FSR family fosmidomycin resistance protein-like MFS transporter
MASTVVRPRTTLATCSAAHVLHDGLTDVLYVLLPLLAQAFGLTYAQVGLLRAATRSAMASFQLPAGLLAERHGERELLALGTFCAGVGFVVLGYAGGFGMILAALFVAGCGHAVQHPLSSAMISHAYPGNGRRAALGTYNFFGDVGKVGVAAAVSALLLAGLHWQQAVVGLGALTIVASIAMLALLPRRMPPRTAPRQSVVVGWGIRHRRGFLALCAIEIVDNTARSGFLTFVAFVMLAKGLPEAWAVLSVPLVAAGGMAGKLACGFLAERIGVVRTIAITEAATAAGIGLMLFLPGALAFLLLPFIGVALNGTSSALYGSVGDLVEPERVSRAFGLFYTLGSACGVAAPLCYGILADQIGVRDTMFVLAAVVLLALPLCLVLRPAMAQTRAAPS